MHEVLCATLCCFADRSVMMFYAILLVLLAILNTSLATSVGVNPHADPECTTSRHADGTLFRTQECSICRCGKSQKKTCRPILCDPIGPCRKCVTPKDKCCPVCLRGQFFHTSTQVKAKAPSEAFTGVRVWKNWPPRINKGQFFCLKSCYFNKRTYQELDFVDLGSCVRCTCRSGRMHCDVQQCNTNNARSAPFSELTECKNPIFLKGQCCPRCEHGRDEICEKKGGFCAKQHKMFFLADPIGKCWDGKRCIALPEIHAK